MNREKQALLKNSSSHPKICKIHCPMEMVFYFTAIYFCCSNYWKTNWNQFGLDEARPSYNMFSNSVLIILYILFVLSAMIFQIVLRDPLVVALGLCHRSLFLKGLHFAVCHIFIKHECFITVMKKVQWRMHLANHNSEI